MNFDLIHIILGILGLSFLVFIHELGHYLVAKKVGMRVEVFSIGFGKPIYSWVQGGVKWQICYLLFGGYVKIAGMEKEGDIEPHLIKDGFFGKKPIDRIKVAVMGPLVNIVFAFLVFTLIWCLGGREKRFEEFTNIIGWVDPKSELVQNGVKPGDTITEYAGKKFTGFKDLVYGGVLNNQSIDIEGDKIDYYTREKIPYQYNLKAYTMPGYPKGVKSLGAVPATYVIFRGFDSKYGKKSPAYGSGILPGDRVVWANGEPIFSALQLNKIVNRRDAFLTIERDDSIFHVRAERISLSELQIPNRLKDEFLDWKRALGIQKTNDELYFIPYEIDVLGVVKGKLNLIDYDLLETNLNDLPYADLDQNLEVGDKIIAVNGVEVSNGVEIFNELKTNKVLLICEREAKQELVPSDKANSSFINSVNWKDLKILTSSVGKKDQLNKIGNLVLLKPIEPLSYEEFMDMQNGVQAAYEPHLVASLKQNKKSTEYLFLGSRVTDKAVIYNPSPIEIFKDVIFETWHTLKSLASGSLSPKWLSGPVGIVKVMQQGFHVGFKEALYWLGLISLNLGIINLLPIPVLDGGHICFSLWEAITKKPISSKVLEKIVFPFVVLMIGFFLYVTFQDISRIFG
jgi:regulator of sigma E protease